jgi:hypothetical protein
MFTPTFTAAGMSTTESAPAIVNTNGIIHIPQSSLPFDPVSVQVNLPADLGSGSAGAAVDRAVATSDFSGGINPTTAPLFVGNIEELWSKAGKIDSCTVGPFHLTRTNVSGAIPYHRRPGTSRWWTWDSVGANPPAPSCDGYAGALNDALPVTTTTTRRRRRPPEPCPVGSAGAVDALAMTPPGATCAGTAHHRRARHPAHHAPTTTTTASPSGYYGRLRQQRQQSGRRRCITRRRRSSTIRLP